jgi:hypothetical protein
VVDCATDPVFGELEYLLLLIGKEASFAAYTATIQVTTRTVLLWASLEHGQLAQ